MPHQLLVFPFGGNAKEALATVDDINNSSHVWDVVGFIDDDTSKKGLQVKGVSVLGDRSILKDLKDTKVLAVPGNPQTYLTRKDIIKKLNLETEDFATLIHPSAVVAFNSTIAHNCLIAANVVIGSGVNIGPHTIILPNTTISHDSQIAGYNCIGANVVISGNVSVDELAYIGSGTSIRDNVHIGARSLIGIGSNVIKDVEEEFVVAGNPAKPLKEKAHQL